MGERRGRRGRGGRGIALEEVDELEGGDLAVPVDVVLFEERTEERSEARLAVVVEEWPRERCEAVLTRALAERRSRLLDDRGDHACEGRGEREGGGRTTAATSDTLCARARLVSPPRTHPPPQQRSQHPAPTPCDWAGGGGASECDGVRGSAGECGGVRGSAAECGGVRRSAAECGGVWEDHTPARVTEPSPSMALIDAWLIRNSVLAAVPPVDWAVIR